MAHADTVIEVRNLSTRFGEQVVHAGLDLEVRRGEIIARMRARSKCWARTCNRSTRRARKPCGCASG
jgi:ABC-type histidine transport system ATPase subunit